MSRATTPRALFHNTRATFHSTLRDIPQHPARCGKTSCVMFYNTPRDVPQLPRDVPQRSRAARAPWAVVVPNVPSTVPSGGAERAERHAQRS